MNKKSIEVGQVVKGMKRAYKGGYTTEILEVEVLSPCYSRVIEKYVDRSSGQYKISYQRLKNTTTIEIVEEEQELDNITIDVREFGDIIEEKKLQPVIEDFLVELFKVYEPLSKGVFIKDVSDDSIIIDVDCEKLRIWYYLRSEKRELEKHEFDGYDYHVYGGGRYMRSGATSFNDYKVKKSKPTKVKSENEDMMKALFGR